MLEAIGGAIAETGAKVASATDATLAADAAAMNSPLPAARAAAAGQFHADLVALYDHHGAVTQLYQQVSDHLAGLGNVSGGLNAGDVVSTDIAEIVNVLQPMFDGGAMTEIEGVQLGNQATLNGAIGSSDSLTVAMKSIQGALGRYLEAIGEVYLKYINADQTGADVLSAASDPGAATIGVPATTSAVAQMSKPIA